MEQTRPRLTILGLDGVAYSLAQSLGQQLPNLHSLVENGACGIRAELPELSPVNWTSFFTAAGPEEHGIFGFTRMHPQTYQLSVVDFDAVAMPTIFHKLGEKGFTSKVINLPNTYPARNFPGMLVSGFVAHDLLKATWPPVLARMLAARNYKLEADTNTGATDHEHLLAEIRTALAGRRAALDMLWPDLAWDVFCLVLTETDRLFHFLMDAVLDKSHRLHNDCIALLQEWDALVGAFLDRYKALPDPKRLLVLADHGFTQLITEVDLNAFLKQRGLLVTAGEPSSEWDAGIIAPEARAFALDPGRIYLHSKSRFQRGQLTDLDAFELREGISQALMQLEYEGQPVMRAVHTREDLYRGPLAQYAPDLVCEPNPGFDLKAKFDRPDIFGTFGRTGTHTADDALFFDSQGATVKSVRDVGRLVLEHFES